MEEFRNYDIRFPELVYDIVDYFRIGNRIKEPIKLLLIIATIRALILRLLSMR